MENSSQYCALRSLVDIDNPVWDIVESPCQDEWEQESGEVVYNKRQNWEYYSNGDGADYSALMLASYFSQKSDLYFQLLNGDKDLLRFAHKALRKEYYMARFPTAGGAIFESRFCGFAFVPFPIQLACIDLDSIRPVRTSGFRACQSAERNATIRVQRPA